MELFNMLHEVRKNGEMALEKNVDDPNNSEIFKKYRKFLANHPAQGMSLDYYLVISGSARADKLFHLMDEEIATHEEEGRRSPESGGTIRLFG